MKSEFKEVVKSLKQQTLKISIQLARRLISMTDVVTLSTCCTWAALGVSVGKRNAWRQQMYWMPLTGFSVSITHSFNGRRKDLQHTKTKPRKATTVFYSIFPFSPMSRDDLQNIKKKVFTPWRDERQKSKTKILETVNASDDGWVHFPYFCIFPHSLFLYFFFERARLRETCKS